VCFIISRAFPTIEYALQMLLLKHPYNNKKVKEDHERVFALIICTPRHARKDQNTLLLSDNDHSWQEFVCTFNILVLKYGHLGSK
jgi:hypothetical protein